MDKQGGTDKKMRPLLLYIFTVVASVFLLVAGNRLAASGLSLFGSGSGQETVRASVIDIAQRETEVYTIEGGTVLENIQITFNAEILGGKNTGSRVSALQSVDSMSYGATREVKPGDRILLIRNDGEDEPWYFMEFNRSDGLIVLGVLFMLALLLFGRRKGVNTLLSLLLTCSAIFLVFVPAILSGRNIYIWSVLVSVYTITSTLLLINGYNKKTLASMAGCIGGLTLAGIISLIMDRALFLTGIVDEHSVYLTFLPTETPINLRAIIFAGIVIGAMGAVMDVAMSISSSLWEVRTNTPSVRFDMLFKSGINIGRDMMGTMTNTLILAYIGSSLSVVLLLSVYSSSLLGLINREMIVVEILQALIGSFGILLALPMTSLFCAGLYSKQ